MLSLKSGIKKKKRENDYEMDFDNGYKDEIREARDQCIVNIMRCHRKILYGRFRISLTSAARENDELMLNTINFEITKLLGKII